MRKTAIILFILFWICFLLLPLWAQTMVGAYSQQYLIPMPLAALETAEVQLLQCPQPVLKVLPDFRLLWALELRASFLFTKLEPVQLTVNRNVFNALYNARRVDEEVLIRKQWQEAFGIDIWVPYYKAKEAEDWVKQRLSIRIGKFKGEPVVSRNSVFYAFKSRF